MVAALIVGLIVAGCSEGETVEAEPDSGPTDTPDSAEPTPPPGYSVSDGVMRDPDGNVLFLRGVNLSGRAKGAEGHLIDVDDALIAELTADGVNSVRFLTFWDAVMPDGDGVLDKNYLDELRARVQRLSDAGIAVVMDVHQDLWGHPFAGHGAPAWACPKELTDGYVSESPWWANYFSKQVTGCFDRFWGSKALQASYADMLAAVAEATCDVPLVVGWDIMNEPWPGAGLGEAGFDNDILMPFYIDVLHRVEEACAGKLFFFEPSGAFTFGLSSAMVVPDELRDRVVIAPHFYPPYVHEPDGGGYGGSESAHEALLADISGDWAEYLDMGVALWCGEYGGMTQSDSFALYMQHLHAFFNEHFISSAYWDHAYGDGGFDFLDSAGALKESLAPVFRTPVPTLLPTPPSAFEVDWATATTSLTIECVSGRTLAMLLPSGSCTCDAPAPLEPSDGRAGHTNWTCSADSGPVTVSCSCP